MMLTDTQLFGVRVCVSDMPSASAAILQRAQRGAAGTVCVANVDMVTRAKRDPKLRNTMRDAAIVVTDGLPLVWMLRRLGHGVAQRVRGPNLMLELCAGCERAGLPVYLYGGSVRESGELVAALARRFPALKIAGAVSPGLLAADPPLDLETAGHINRSGARIVFVGLGCPKQEYWMANHAGQLQAISIGVGLAFAEIGGSKARAPDWMSNNGLEWLYRLFQEPRRLWRRYLVGNSLFVWYSVQALAKRWFVR